MYLVAFSGFLLGDFAYLHFYFNCYQNSLVKENFSFLLPETKTGVNALSKI